MYLKKYCCDKNTHYSSKMKNCESTLHTIAGHISSNNSIDHIFTLETNPSMVVTNEKVVNVLITDHKPVFCIINTIPILSWNLEGLCRTSEETEVRTHAIQHVLSQMHKKYPSIIFMFQELFLKHVNFNYTMGIDRLHMLFHNSNYKYIYDGYTGGIIIPQNLYNKNIHVIHRNESKKKSTMIYVRAAKPFYLINIHLQAVLFKPMRDSTHIAELSNIFEHIKHKIKKGVALIGDYNNTNIVHVYKESIQAIFTK
jgi:hypothetical protein